MRSIVYLLLIVLPACATVREDLGHGFKVIRKRERMERSFEKYGYYDFLRYHRRNLGSVGEVSISPEGRYALFEQGGKLMLFDSGTGVSTDVTGGRFMLPKAISWHESEGIVVVTFSEEGTRREITLRPK